MKNKLSILGELVHKLSREEVSAARKALRSPYFNYREDLNVLFETLLRNGKRKNPLSVSESFSLVYPDCEFDDLKWRAAKSDLMEVLEKMIITRQTFLRPENIHLILARFYRERKLERHFNRKLNKLEKLLDNHSFRDHNYYQNKLDFELENMKAKALTQQKRTSDLLLQSIGDRIDANYLFEKLRHTCTMLTHQMVFPIEYDPGLLKSVIEQVEEGGFLDYLPVAVYYYCYRFLTEPEKISYFKAFRDCLEEAENKFKMEELKDLYLLGINFCIKKLNQGQVFYAREGFELYKSGLQSEVLMTDGILTKFTFNNIVGIGSRLEEFEWTEKFIDQYANNLEKEYRTASVNFNRARIAFSKGAYSSVILLLQKTEIKDIVDNLISKMLLTKVYYELEEINLLESHLSNFLSYIRRNKVSKFHSQNFKNIIRFVRKLIAIPKFEKEKRKILKQEIESTEILSERNWLLQQLN